MSKPAALITGAASGIGLATAKHLLSRGYRVGMIDLNRLAGEAEAEKLGADALFLHVDITDYAQQARAFKRVHDWASDRLDIFVANAGVADTDAIYKEGELDEEGLPRPVNLKVFDVNLDAVVQGIRLFTHFARRRDQVSGKIIVTSSIVGLYPNYTIPLYSASKHALVGLVRSLAPVIAAENITINALCPVMIETGLMPEQFRHLWPPEQLTPLSTATKAYDTIIDNDTINGQTIELSLDDLIFKQPPEYSNDNVRWMFGSMNEWETATEMLMPRAIGKNVKKTS